MRLALSEVKLGWCLDGHHTGCPGEIRFHGKIIRCNCTTGTHTTNTHKGATL